MYVDIQGFIQMIMFLGSVGAIPTGIALKIHWLWAAGIGSIFLYPVLLELLVYGWAFVSHSEGRYKRSLHERRLKMANCLPLVYHSGYNLSACGLEKLHPFDAIKYQRYLDL